jgi:hypothetical protein
MKIHLLGAAAAAITLAGCVVSEPPAVTTVRQPVPLYQPGYVVTTLPTGYRTVNYHRNVYYVDRDVYYTRHPHGYVVVTSPY